MLSQSEKDEIVREFRESTSNRAMKRYECSFCGKLELADNVKMRPVKSLDISLLEKAVRGLREAVAKAIIDMHYGFTPNLKLAEVKALAQAELEVIDMFTIGK
ncbi:hypothetical protein V5O48_018223, partial [Marasmius crinis-equi]